MSIETLKALMPPPLKPSETGSGDGWDAIEAELGFVLPADYKQFIGIYGTGSVDNFLWVSNPFSSNQYLNLIKRARAALDALRTLRDDFGEQVPYALYPDSNGLFPWATTDNGDVLYWLRKTPDLAIVINESRSPEWEEYDLTTTGFLSSLLTSKLVVNIFPDNFPSNSPRFIPFYSLSDYQERKVKDKERQSSENG